MGWCGRKPGQVRKEWNLEGGPVGSGCGLVCALLSESHPRQARRHKQEGQPVESAVLIACSNRHCEVVSDPITSGSIQPGNLDTIPSVSLRRKEVLSPVGMGVRMD